MIWQFVTYAFMHLEFWHWFGNMLGLWMFGAAIEERMGNAAISGIVFLWRGGRRADHHRALRVMRTSWALRDAVRIGASGGVFAILMAFGMLFGENEIMMIPFPFLIKAKYFVGILIVVTLVLAIGQRRGCVCGPSWRICCSAILYVRFAAPKARLVNVALSERYYGMRNSYYRWKRRRAAKKFEVYMRKHDRDVHFDEHGNYVPPDDDPHKGNGGSKSGWVN